MASTEWNQEEQFVACMFVMGLPRNKICNDASKTYGLSSSFMYREECEQWFEASGIPGIFLKGEIPGVTGGRGWWVEYKKWLYNHGCRSKFTYQHSETQHSAKAKTIAECSSRSRRVSLLGE